MNVYLLFALAFGAVTTAADVRVSRVAATTAAIGVLAVSAVSVAGRRSPVVVARTTGNLRPATGDHSLADAPLTGAATPRAPAHNC